MKPLCFWSSATHRSKTLSSSRQAAKAKDLSAASAPIHARPLRLNLFCETSLLFVSRHSPLKDTQFKQPKKTSSKGEGPFCRLSKASVSLFKPFSQGLCKASARDPSFCQGLCKGRLQRALLFITQSIRHGSHPIVQTSSQGLCKASRLHSPWS